MKQQNLDAAGKVASVLSGKVDGLIGFAHDQGPTIANKSGKAMTYLKSADAGVNFYSNGLISSDSYLSKNKDLATEMMAAVSESFEAAVKNPNGSREVDGRQGSSIPPASVVLAQWTETIKLLHTPATSSKKPGVNDPADWAATSARSMARDCSVAPATPPSITTHSPSRSRGEDMTATVPDILATGTSPVVGIENMNVTFSSKRGTVTALEGINLSVAPGEFLSIAGPSGCGKSTLLKVVAGLTRASDGTVELRGQQVKGPRRDIGYVFQRAALLEWRNVRGNILLQAEMRGMDRAKAARRADELIEMTGLAGFENSMPHELSGGMQQRVSLCRALLHETRRAVHG